MGQINCQQCTMPFLQQTPVQEVSLQKKPNQHPNLHRINTLSNRRNSLEVLHKKQSIQTTRQDTQEIISQSQRTIKDKCIVELDNGSDVIHLQIQKDKKYFFGTSKNCQFFIKSQNHQNNFKVQVNYSDQCLTFIDMAVGLGSFIKISVFHLNNDNYSQTQVYLIDGHFIRISIDQIIQSKSFHIILEQMQSKVKSMYNLSFLDVILSRQCERIFQVDQHFNVQFKIRRNYFNEIQLVFNHQNCWKYIKNKTIINKNSILSLGSMIYHVKKLNFSKDMSNQSQIKIMEDE